MATSYSCPMHPEIKQENPGHCPKCGMKLVESSEIKKTRALQTVEVQNSYRPLVIIIVLIIIASLTTSIQSFNLETFSLRSFLSHFMAGFFLVFSGFKLIDLKGFAEGYSTYDLLAKRWFTYRYFYPFIELFLGLAMLTGFQTKPILIAEIIVMVFSGLGVAIKLLKHEKFQCACLGTFLKVPLTKVTLVEDFGMSLLALILLLWK